MERKIGIGILGGTGYGAGELLRLLVNHPLAEVVSITSSSQAGAPVTEAHHHLDGFYDLRFDKELEFDRFSAFEYKVLFSSLPHGTSAQSISAILNDSRSADFRIIDLSGDFRLKNEQLRKVHYPEAHADNTLYKSFIYGLTEVNRENIAEARFIANPGCLASACILVASPITALGLKGSISFDAKTGTSGAGKTPQAVTHHPTRHANMAAYKVLEHRHEPEILQGLFMSGATDDELLISFVPHLLPSARGIFVTAYVLLEQNKSFELKDTGSLSKYYEDFYRGSSFIRIRNGSPDLQSVLGSNFCDISVVVRGNQLVLMGTLDNLVKGMVGQAIQNMNVMLGQPETLGLWQPALGPI